MKDKLIDYYNEYDEESRLIKDKSHQVEFDTTVHFLDNYIQPQQKLLDIGAGTGRYSFYYARRGISVFAMDLVDKHVEIIKNKLVSYDNIDMFVEKGNALDLSRYSDETFDIALCMGPLYHLSGKDKRMKCLKECKRVLRSEGLLVVAYINEIVHKEMGSNSCFIGLNPNSVESVINELDFEIREHLATDGVAPRINNFISGLDNKSYQSWLNFHLKTCKLKISLENTLHALIIAEKVK